MVKRAKILLGCLWTRRAPTEVVLVLRRFDNRGCAERVRSGSLYVHKPSYKTQDYSAHDHQDSLLGGRDLLH